MHTASRFLPNPSIWRARWLPEARVSCWAGTPVQAYVANVLFLLLVAVCLACWQFEHYYWHATYLQRMDLALLDRGVIYWILCARNLVLLLPALAIGALCVWRRRFKLAMNVSGLLAAAVVAWLLIEMDVQRTYGRTLSAFGDYLVQPKTWQLGGGAASHLAAIVPRVALAVVLVSGLLLVGQATVSWVAGRWTTAGSSYGYAAASVIWAAVAFGPLVVRSAVGQPAALDVLEAVQPTPLAMFSGSQAGCRPFGERCADAHFAAALAGLQATLTTPAWPQKIPSLGRSDLPNILMVVVESLRHDTLNGDMPRLERRLPGALVLDRHYAASNRTELGLFSLLYGRSAIAYEPTLSQAVSPHLCHYLRQNGYRCSFVSSHDPVHRGMERFISQPSFDDVVVHSEGWWYERDRKSLAAAQSILTDHDGTPQFVVVFLMSTHYHYQYPPEYCLHEPDTKWKNSRVELRNRYRNALRFTDDAVDQLLDDLDPADNLVIVTSDHGESFFEDGTLTHACRLSEITCRVPLVMYGAGVAPGRVAHPTQHADVLPTLLHALAGKSIEVPGGHGRDLLGGEPYSQQIILGQPVEDPADEWQLLLVRPEARLGMLISPHREGSRLLGFFDQRGQPDPRQSRPATAVAIWKTALEDELKRWNEK